MIKRFNQFLLSVLEKRICTNDQGVYFWIKSRKILVVMS